MPQLTIAISVKNPTCSVHEFMRENRHVLAGNPVVVVDSGGGHDLQEIAEVYIKRDVPLSSARRICMLLANTTYILNLDIDNILPHGYVETAIQKLEADGHNVVAALIYAYPHNHGHVGFGTSIWKTDALRALYDWTEKNTRHICECLYIWEAVRKKRLRIVTLPFEAKHLKEIGTQ